MTSCVVSATCSSTLRAQASITKSRCLRRGSFVSSFRAPSWTRAIMRSRHESILCQQRDDAEEKLAGRGVREARITRSRRPVLLAQRGSPGARHDQRAGAREIVKRLKRRAAGVPGEVFCPDSVQVVGYGGGALRMRRVDTCACTFCA